MEKFRIWEDNKKSMLIPEKEIEYAYETSEDLILVSFPSIVGEEGLETKLNNLIENDQVTIKSPEDVEEFLGNYGYEANASYTDWLTKADENDLIFNPYYNEFTSLSAFEKVPVYRWYNGSEWKEESLTSERDVSEKKLEVGDKHLTINDGNVFRREIKKIYKIDGEVVEDYFLIIEYSKFPQDHTSGKIITREDLEELLDELGKDINVEDLK